MKKRLLILFYIMVISIFTIVNLNVKAEVLESSSDAFMLLDKSYEQNDKFVFTARANFQSGQAAGIVFGASENEYYYVLNMDRYENTIKLMYFSKNENSDGYNVEVLKSDMFIGNDKMTDGEKNMVFPKVRTIDNVDFKVVITPQDDKVYAEFFVDGIKRFGVDEIIILDEKYVGGYLGYNTFNSKVDFTDVEIGESDYSYYTELYRQQYHFSQFKNWNNDPNGLVYYEGYYHLFFQHHPFSKFWSDMYWGHARSKDLVHWEQLPICVFPDEYGYAWSGSAMVYHKGTNSVIDKWFTKDTGLLAYYTADGAKQNQIIMSSDDGGMTWTKHKEYVISQDLVPTPNGLNINDKFDCRDPRVFEVEDNGQKLYGMVVSGMNPETVWLLQSTDMLHWSFATKFNLFRPECVDVLKITADDNTTHTVLTFEGREYLVGEFKINSNNKIYFEKYNSTGNMDVTNKTKEEINASKMDYGPDSYATQSFYIDDPASKYYGKSISVSWFSGVPGAEASADSGSFAEVRTKWNGSGFTIPVEIGLKKIGDEYVLTQTPITLDNSDFDKEVIVNEANVTYTPASDNVLANVNTHQLEVFAKFNNPNKEEIEFRLNIGENEYTVVGWNKTDGYYVDRTNTSDAGINFPNYHRKYTTGPVDTETPTFYILSDNGSIEVFCEDFTKPFYVLTLPSVYSTKAELEVTGEVLIETLKVNKIKSVFYDEDLVTNEGVVYLDKSELTLDMTFTKKDSILFYTTLNVEPTWEITQGENIVSITTDNHGAQVEALAPGSATIKVTCGNVVKEIKVKVEDGSSISDIEFKPENIIGGKWYQTTNGLVGNKPAGDGYILSTKYLKDCYYTAQFDLGSGAAAALILRAKADMSDYIMVNYDKNGNIVKVWTSKREIANVYVGSIDPANITLTAEIEGNNGKVMLNGMIVTSFVLTDTDPQEGYLGLNVCATKATFKSVALQDLEFNYNGGDLVIKGNVIQYINKITNVTINNQNVDKSFIKVDGRNIIISEEYFTTLTNTGVYQFEIYGTSSRISITVNINSLPTVSFEDVELIETEKLNVYIGNTGVTSVYVNGVLLTNDQYVINNYTLTIDGSLLNVGENTIKINDEEIKVTVRELGTTDFETPVIPDNPTPSPKPSTNKFNPLVIIIPAVAVLLGGIAVAVIVIKKKRV